MSTPAPNHNSMRGKPLICIYLLYLLGTFWYLTTVPKCNTVSSARGCREAPRTSNGDHAASTLTCPCVVVKAQSCGAAVPRVRVHVRVHVRAARLRRFREPARDDDNRLYLTRRSRSPLRSHGGWHLGASSSRTFVRGDTGGMGRSDGLCMRRGTGTVFGVPYRNYSEVPYLMVSTLLYLKYYTSLTA